MDPDQATLESLTCRVGVCTGGPGVFLGHLCNAPSGALGSPTWMRGVMQGNSKGSGFSEDLSAQDSGEGSKVKGRSVEHRGLLRDWDDTRSSPHPSVVALGCLGGGDERGRGQGCYSRRLGQRPGTDTASRVEFKEELGLNLLGGKGTH